MPEKGKLFPDIQIDTVSGERVRLWDLRQKTHVLLVCEGPGAADALGSLESRRKEIDWLGVRVLQARGVPEGLAPRAYAIDRYGELLEDYALDGSVAEKVEKDFTYYESCHC